MVSTIINVSDATELQSALASATGGETILLAAGHYGGMVWFDGRTKFDVTHSAEAPVTIRSADAGNPAVFSQMRLYEVSGFTFEDLMFDYTYKTGDNISGSPFKIIASDDLTFRGCTFDGDVAVGRNIVDDGYGFGKGLVVTGGANFVFEENTIHSFHRGITCGGGENTVIRGNHIYDIRSDMMDFSAMRGVVIEDNDLHGLRSALLSADHPSFIQFWTTNTTTPSTDVVIRNNRIDIGTGDKGGGIFMRNEEVDNGRAGPEMYYRNILIEGNTIYGDYSHGITVGETAGLVIRNNAVLHAEDLVGGLSGSNSIPKIRVLPVSTGVVIENNISAAITGSDPATRPVGWTVSNNLLAQDENPMLPNHYASIFITSTLDDRDGVHRFVARADGAIELLGQGSAETRYASAVNGTDAYFTVTEDSLNGAKRIFDATFMADILGDADLTADYLWDFGCGHTASGKKVAHDYAAFKGGLYDVTLTIVLGNGATRTGNAIVPVHGELIVDFDATTGTFWSRAFGFEHSIAAPKSLDGDAIQLGAPGFAAKLPLEDLLEISGSDDFDIDFSIKADTVGASGELFRHHMQYIATIDAAGELGFQVFTADGQSTRLVTSGLDLNDGLWHNIDIQIREGAIRLLADGELKVDHTLSAEMNFNPSNTFVIGNPWNDTNFAGDMSFLQIRSHVGDYPETPDHSEVIILVPDNVGGTGMHDPGWTGQIFDLAASTTKLMDNAHVVTGLHTPVLHLDGNKDYASLGRQVAVETSDRVGFSVDFLRDTVDDVMDRLIWNHMRMGLTLTRDGLVVEVATRDQGFKKFTADNLGLDDAELHRAEVMVDSVADRLQVLLDGDIVIDATDADFDLSTAAATPRNWTIGTPWNRFLDGEVHDFRLGDQFHFV
jgi:hypothetical protein